MLFLTNSDVNDAFINVGNLVISRTSNSISPIGINRCHERLIKLIKGDGEAIGHTED